MFDKSSVGRNSSGQWAGALHLLGDPWETLELPVLGHVLCRQCWDGPTGAWVALKAASSSLNLLIFKEYIFLELLLLYFWFVCGKHNGRPLHIESGSCSGS